MIGLIGRGLRRLRRDRRGTLAVEMAVATPVVSSISATNGNPARINWQRFSSLATINP